MKHKWKILLAAACLAWTGFGVVAIANADSLYVTDKILLGIHQAPSEDSPVIKSVSSGTELKVLQSRGDFTQVHAPDGTEGWVSSSYLVSDLPANKALAALRDEADKDKKALAALRDEADKDKKTALAMRDQLQVKNNELRDQKAKYAALQKQLAAAKSSAANSPEGKALAAAKDEIKALKAKLANLNTQEQAQAKELATPDQKEIKRVQDQNVELQARIEQAIASLNGKKLPPADQLAAVRPVFPPWYIGLLAVTVLIGFIGGVVFLDHRYRKRHGGFRV